METPSVHERHRALLDAFRDDRLALAAMQRMSLTSARDLASWRRCYARFTPDDDPRVTLAYEGCDCARDIVLLTLHGRGRAALESGLATEFGWLQARRFTADPALPTIDAVLAAYPAAHVVRYRPLRRCTLRVALPGGAVRFGKVFPDERGAILQIESEALCAAVAGSGLPVRVALPLGWDPQMRCHWQSAVTGAPVADGLAGPGAGRLARRLGAALASMTQLSLVPAAVLDGPAQLARTARYAEVLVRAVPVVGRQVQALLTHLAAIHARTESRPLVSIHGSPHVHQWLDDGDSLGLVDFDRLSLGEPELDVATFLAELDFEDRQRVSVPTVGAAFIDGFESVAGPLRPELLAAYRCHKRLAKAVRLARSFKPDGDRRAAAALAFAAAALCEPDRVEDFRE